MDDKGAGDMLTAFCKLVVFVMGPLLSQNTETSPFLAVPAISVITSCHASLV